MLIVGIDPDTKKHGVAVVKDGIIQQLYTLGNKSLIELLTDLARQHQLRIKMEDINAFKPVIHRSGQSRNQMMKIAQNIGAVKYAAELLVHELASAGFSVEMVLPLQGARSGKRYKSDAFNRLTGWNGKSNADNRDAAMIALYGQPKGGISGIFTGK
ncbi:hypothetical protein [Rheinheimera mesophila]|uniref:hypothetical protein n=1 Tax=Rheinheimera mesophila TaxID=1547515 RepID=UPI0006999B23|nr:hypothetical protein [Rheinheimera mesophila]